MPQRVSDYLDLPASVPKCVIEIRGLDDPESVVANIRDYVLTKEIRWEMVGSQGKDADKIPPGLLQRIIASVKRGEPGEGHWIHGSFGSGKSHFMSILALMLTNHPALWAESNFGSLIGKDERDWLEGHGVLAIPVFMLDQRDLATAIYTQTNARLQRLGQPPCAFTDTDAIIEGFEVKRGRLGDDAFKLLSDVGVDKDLYEASLGDSGSREELAAKILYADGKSRTDDIQALYPSSLTEGMNLLTVHARGLGYRAVVILLDELILYLAGKSGRTYLDEINALGALVDNKGGRACPLWVLAARQRNIAETVPEDTSQQHIHEALQRLEDRFPRDTQLSDRDLTFITRERVLRPRDEDAGRQLRLEIDNTLNRLDPQVAETLSAQWSLDDFRRLYPFHPALLQTLVDITNQLSRERTAIRVLYELLIERYPDLLVGQLVPYHGLFDVIFREQGILGGSRQRDRELEAVRRTYYEQIRPKIAETFPGEEGERQRAQAEVIIKTVLLCQLTKAFRDDITIGRIVNLNPEDLRGRRALATHNLVSETLRALSSRCELVVFRQDETNAAGSRVNITVQQGVLLTTDILPQVPVTQQDRTQAFMGLVSELLGKREIRDGVLVGFRQEWRGTQRAAKVRFANVSELSSADMAVDGEFTLYIDHPYDTDPSRSVAGDEETIRRARADLGALPVGFWLPQFLEPQDMADLEQLAKLQLLSGDSETARRIQAQQLGRLSTDQQAQVRNQVYTFLQAKQTSLLQRIEDCYLRGDAKCVFLDTTIAPNLDAGSMREALSRIADTALDSLHPHHPRFKGKVETQGLQPLLERVVLPVCASGKPILLDSDLRTRVEALAVPLEFGAPGVQSWSLSEDGRYLRRVRELAEGANVQADGIRVALAEQFGFQDNLVDFFLLLLIRGYGFRAFKGQDPAPASELTFGKLRRLRLVKGTAVTPVQWSEAKRRVKRGWGADAIQPVCASGEHNTLKAALEANQSVAAQDDLWRALQGVARCVQRQLDAIRGHMDYLQKQLGAEKVSTRAASLTAVGSLNGVPLGNVSDPHDGLVALTQWSPGDGTTDAVLDGLASVPPLLLGMQAINRSHVQVVATVAGTDPAAAQLLQDLSALVNGVGKEGGLQPAAQKWNSRANAWLLTRLRDEEERKRQDEEERKRREREERERRDEEERERREREERERREEEERRRREDEERRRREGEVLQTRTCTEAELETTLDSLKEQVQTSLREGKKRVTFTVTVEG